MLSIIDVAECDVAVQGGPLIAGVGDGFADRAFGQDRDREGFQALVDLGDARPREQRIVTAIGVGLNESLKTLEERPRPSPPSHRSHADIRDLTLVNHDMDLQYPPGHIIA